MQIKGRSAFGSFFPAIVGLGCVFVVTFPAAAATKEAVASAPPKKAPGMVFVRPTNVGLNVRPNAGGSLVRPPANSFGYGSPTPVSGRAMNAPPVNSFGHGGSATAGARAENTPSAPGQFARFRPQGVVSTAPGQTSRPYVRAAEIQFTRNMPPELVAQNVETLNESFLASMKEMLIAQAYTIAALGEKDKADQLNTEAASLEGKNDLNTVSHSISISQDASSEINNKINSAGAIDDEARDMLRQAVPHYADGMSQAAQLPIAYKNALSATMSEAKGGISTMFGRGGLLSQASDLLVVTTHVPSLISAWGSTTSNFQKFAHGNSVDTSNLSGKI